MKNTALTAQISDDTTRALIESAKADGIAASDLLEFALERELRRREKRRALIARSRRLTAFPPLGPRTD